MSTLALARSGAKARIAAGASRAAMRWWVYLLCNDQGVYYIGATLDTRRRLKQHNAGKGGAFTRSRRPWRLLLRIKCPNQSVALSLEYWLKQVPAKRKEQAFIDRGAVR